MTAVEIVQQFKAGQFKFKDLATTWLDGTEALTIYVWSEAQEEWHNKRQLSQNKCGKSDYSPCAVRAPLVLPSSAARPELPDSLLPLTFSEQYTRQPGANLQPMGVWSDSELVGLQVTALRKRNYVG